MAIGFVSAKQFSLSGQLLPSRLAGQSLRMINPAPVYAAFRLIGVSLLPGSEAAVCEKERFWTPVFSNSLRFLHRLMRGAVAPASSTSTTITIPKDMPHELLAGFAGAGVVVLAVSAGVLAVASGAASATGGFAVSSGVGVAAAAAFAGPF